MKKRLAIAPLFFACAMLLAHVAVPHHHHNGTIICLLNFNSEVLAESNHIDGYIDDEECGHDDAGEGHHHGDNDSEENCFIDDLYLASETKHSMDAVYCDQRLSTITLTATLNLNTAEIVPLTGLPFREKPYKVSYRSLINSESSGLRGPPTC